MFLQISQNPPNWLHTIDWFQYVLVQITSLGITLNLYQNLNFSTDTSFGTSVSIPNRKFTWKYFLQKYILAKIQKKNDMASIGSILLTLRFLQEFLPPSTITSMTWWWSCPRMCGNTSITGNYERASVAVLILLWHPSAHAFEPLLSVTGHSVAIVLVDGSVATAL